MSIRTLLASVLVACGLAAPATAQSSDPIARTREGKVECYTFDRAARTCRAMSTYRFLPGGRIVNDAIVFLQNDPHVVMYVSSDVTVRDAMICGRVEQADLEAARFEVDGVAAAPEDASSLREAVAQFFVGIGEICSRYTETGDVTLITVFVDGVERPDLADRMIWIGPDDGYTMGAAPTSET